MSKAIPIQIYFIENVHSQGFSNSYHRIHPFREFTTMKNTLRVGLLPTSSENDFNV
jgi:hypothetical protein